MPEQELVASMVAYFERNIFNNHIETSLTKNSKLSSYKINPIVVKYLSRVLDNEYTPEGVAKALYFPRVLGTSINTIFGTWIQKMFVELDIANGSMIKGMDIEFIDHIDNRHKWCQLKAGPNTINSEDVAPLIKKFNDTVQLARTNHALTGVANTDFIVGVLYGETDDLSAHYRRIDQTYPVHIGSDFWTRITGYQNLYANLVQQLHRTIEAIDTRNLITDGWRNLASEIEDSTLFEF